MHNRIKNLKNRSLQWNFEKTIFKQLYQFFLDKTLLYNAQYGFRTDHSTELATLELVDTKVVEMDKINTRVNIFLDLLKAFDTLDHEILLYKLKNYGINRASFKLMESYIKYRKQYVEIEGIHSEMSTPTTGVPQGSILGPLLFIIYINDITNSGEIFVFVIYTDDTSLSTTLEIVIRNKMIQLLI